MPVVMQRGKVFIGLLGRMFSGHARNRGNKGHPAMIRLDLVKAEQHAGMQALLHGTHMALDLFASRDNGAIGRNEILSQLGLEVLALF